MRNSKLVPRILAFLLAAGFALLWTLGLLDAYTDDQKLTLLLLGIAIALWTVSAMPLAASSLLVLGLLLNENYAKPLLFPPLLFPFFHIFASRHRRDGPCPCCAIN